MNKTLFFSLGFLVFCCSTIFSQEVESEFVIFEYHHSMRIRFNNVKVEIRKEKNSAEINVTSNALNEDKSWDYSRINDQYKISISKFEELQAKTYKLNTLTFPENVYGLDGFVCSIKFNKGNENFNYSFFCPSYHDKNSNIDYFLDTCKEIVIAGKLNPKEIFANKGD